MKPVIETRELSPQPVLVMRGRATPPELAETFARLLGGVLEHLGAHDSAIPGAPFMRYLGMTDVFEIEVGVPNPRRLEGSSRVVATELPGGPVATTVHHGPYSELGTTWDALFAWAEERGRIAHRDGGWDVYENDPSQVSRPEELVTRLHLPLR